MLLTSLRAIILCITHNVSPVFICTMWSFMKCYTSLCISIILLMQRLSQNLVYTDICLIFSFFLDYRILTPYFSNISSCFDCFNFFAQFIKKTARFSIKLISPNTFFDIFPLFQFKMFISFKYSLFCPLSIHFSSLINVVSMVSYVYHLVHPFLGAIPGTMTTDIKDTIEGGIY